MSVIIQSGDLSNEARFPRGMWFRRNLGDGEIAVGLWPNGQFDDPEEVEFARGRPTVFVNQWGTRVCRVGDVTFWEEIEDLPEIGFGPEFPIQRLSRVTVWVTVHS